jgi:hypothetical protein
LRVDAVDHNLGIVLYYLSQPLHRVWLDEASLDFYRHNLRLHAAHNKGAGLTVRRQLLTTRTATIVAIAFPAGLIFVWWWWCVRRWSR